MDDIDLDRDIADINFTTLQGREFAASLTLFTPGPDYATDSTDKTPRDLSACSAIMQARAAPGSATPVIDLADGNGITIDGGTISWLVPWDQMLMDARPYRYDLQLVGPDGPEPIARGSITVEPRTSRYEAPEGS